MELIIYVLANALRVESRMLGNTFSFIGLLFSVVVPLYVGGIIFWHYRVRRFLDQVIYSANYFRSQESGKTTLYMRTLCTLPINDLLPENKLFRLQLYFAIRRCTRKNMFITMSAEDMDVLQPALISGFSSVFGEGFTAALLNMPVFEEKLYMAVTFEKDGSVKSQKIRVILATAEQLSLALKLDSNEVSYERSHHAYRLTTLKCMAQQLQAQQNEPAMDIQIIQPVFCLFRS